MSESLRELSTQAELIEALSAKDRCLVYDVWMLYDRFDPDKEHLISAFAVTEFTKIIALVDGEVAYQLVHAAGDSGLCALPDATDVWHMPQHSGF